MIRHTLYMAIAFALLSAFAGSSYSVDFNSLADQSSYRCSGGVVAVGDLDRDVREKCGDPLMWRPPEDRKKTRPWACLDILSRPGNFYVLPRGFKRKITANCGCSLQC